MTPLDTAVELERILSVGAPLWVYYVDDSGDGRTIAVFGALAFDLARHGEAMRDWLRFRAELAADPRLLIPEDALLHCEHLAGARGRHLHLSRSTDRETHRRHCQEVILRGLETIAKLPGVSVCAAYRRTNDYARDRPALFAAFLARINAELATAGAYGIAVVDGKDTDHALSRAYRQLSEHGRRIIAAPLFFPAREVDLLQAADKVAYSTYQSIAQRENRRFMWDWAPRTLPWRDGPWAL
ncbi:DUF3800 domain-containing protein [Kitasatospora sp. NPDC048343]|uniref:DUF3800 domain-containing protein n=1 Tax=Kitasatospora sp. NPDC048343 TaxID=3154717 RepID=UPI0033E586F8